ncbi:peroxisome biogenesis factor 10-like [Homalodisca vitripennis]|uniref:peroxisome biogenesis factor 10-like n=1 Tax=Homalodisca vitripennis TaxID=197043 RepID=UPI001EEC4D6A|nr:peroxisome biogenesis factor 10-like [Homalodisca vitripennis]
MECELFEEERRYLRGGEMRRGRAVRLDTSKSVEKRIKWPKPEEKKEEEKAKALQISHRHVSGVEDNQEQVFSSLLLFVTHSAERILSKNADSVNMLPQNRLLMLVLDNFGSVLLTFGLNKLDKALFYCGGLYYQISKRFTSIQYVLVRRWLKDYQSMYGFKLLGIVTAIHLIGTSMHSSWKWFFTPKTSEFAAVEEPASQCASARKCPLCLEERRNVSATPCGHLFCWSCILEWLQTQNQCPLCRERVEPSRIVPLKNYL